MGDVLLFAGGIDHKEQVRVTAGEIQGQMRQHSQLINLYGAKRICIGAKHDELRHGDLQGLA